MPQVRKFHDHRVLHVDGELHLVQELYNLVRRLAWVARMSAWGAHEASGYATQGDASGCATQGDAGMLSPSW